MPMEGGRSGLLNPWERIFQTIGEASALEMVAEEAAELSAAALKAARILRGDNPARIDYPEAMKDVVEEIGDTFNAVNVLGSGLMPDGRLVGPSAMDAKMKRWYDSLFGGDSHG